MFNLYQIVTGAQGGQALDNLANQFGLSRAQADSAVTALIPAISTAFMAKTAQPGGLGALAGSLGDDHHAQAYTDASVAQDPATQQKGGSVAGSIFGDSAIVDQVVQQASRYTGIPAATLEQMLPVIISIVVGGVGTAMREKGMGGLLGQLAESGLGGILGQFGGAAAQPGTTGPGGIAGGMGGAMGGVLSSILGSFLGGGAQHAHPQAPAPQDAAPDGPAPRANADPAQPNPFGLSPAMQAGMDALSKMFNPGVPASAAQPDDLGEKIGSILDDKKK